ncbi:hypothetical protein FNV43_RR13291 [Rhamnella rubrinervis]|uniref:DUF7054 domain-containing protein n=1 Tax=Rhamnella rubrinervis TaxID=2594499 RepID=A0A8K0MF53_9ROSA|nr:hypothetical protein FNV43_RR13291 [Rhamnella rubrinervis]
MSKRPEKKNNGENQNVKKSRFLITVNVVGSAGPIRFVVNEDDLVSGVIDTALKTYAREGRLPVLGSDAKDFLLYCANAESDVVLQVDCVLASIFKPIGKDRISWRQEFCAMQEAEAATDDRRKPDLISHKGVSSWKAWLYRVLYF